MAYGPVGAPPSAGGGTFSIAAGTVTNGLYFGPVGGSVSNGGSITINSYQTTTSAVGSVTLGSPAFMTLSAGAGTTNYFAGGNLVRLGASTLELVGPNAGSVQAFFTNGIVMDNGIVAPWMINAGGTPDFWTYTSSGLVSAANTAAFGANTATQYVRCGTTAAATNLTANTSALAVYNNSNPVNLNTYTLKIGDGTNAGLMVRNNFIGSSGTIDFGTATAFVWSAVSGTNYCRIAGTNGFVKFGGGSVTLASDTPYGGPIWVNNGTLTLRPAVDMTVPGPVVGPGILTKEGTNALTLGGGDYIGTFIHNGGALAFGGGYVYSFTASTGSVTLTGDTAANTFTVSGGTAALSANLVANTFTVNGATATLGANVLANTVALGAGGTVVVSAGCTLTNLAASMNSAGGTLIITNGGRFSTPNVSGVSFACYPSVLMGGTNPVTGQLSTWDVGGGSPYLYGPSTSRFDNALLTNVYSASFGVDSSSSYILFTNGTFLAASTTVYAARATVSSTVNYNTIALGGSNAVTGQKTTWNLNGNALVFGNRVNPSTVVSNTFVVTAGAVVTNAGFVTIGNGSGGTYNKMSVIGGGRVFCISNVVVGASQSSTMLEVLDSGSLWDLGGGALIVGQRGDSLISGCWARVSGNAVVTNAGAVTVGSAGGNAAGSDSDSLIITNGGRLISAGLATVGTITGGTPGDSRNNFILVTGPTSFWSVGGGALQIGWGSQGLVLSNYMTIDQGALVTNVGPVTLGYANIAKPSYGNALNVTNGSTLVSTGLVTIGNSAAAGTMASNNVATVVGGPAGSSLWDVRGAAIKVGNNGVTGSTNCNNSLVIGPGGTVANGGLVWAGAIVSTGLATGNVVTVSGGTLESTGMIVYVTGGGNGITNSGGIYQFTVPTPMITNAGFGSIALDNGTIAFRNVNNANVKGNWLSSLTNISFTGINTFRLNNAANNSPTNQSYTFAANAAAPTNYAGLELVNGNTAYTNGSVTIATNGWLTFSNTTAVMWGAVTNYGTMTLYNSTVAFMQNLTLGESNTLIMTSNSTVTVGPNGTLRLPTNTVLTVPGILDPMTVLNLFQATNSIVGSPSWTLANQSSDFKITLSPDGKRLVLRPRVKGFLFIAE